MTRNAYTAEPTFKAATTMGASQDVNIIDSNGNVGKDPVHARQGAGDWVTWFSHDNLEATIVFNGASPFTQRVIPVPAGGNGASSRVRPGAALGQYKYTVVCPGGATDPVVIIDP